MYFLPAHTELSVQGGGCDICPNEIVCCWNDFPALFQTLAPRSLVALELIES